MTSPRVSIIGQTHRQPAALRRNCPDKRICVSCDPHPADNSSDEVGLLFLRAARAKVLGW